MEQKVKGYGARGWVLIIWIATAFLAYTAIGNYPLNIMADLFNTPVFDPVTGAPMFDEFGQIMLQEGTGQSLLSTLYTVGSVIGVLIQLVGGNFIGRMKSVKRFGCIMGLISIICLLGIMFVPGYAGVPALKNVWLVFYTCGTVISSMYGTFAISILVGQWFPTRKGGVMGIATFAFPIGNGVLGAFAGQVFAANEYGPLLFQGTNTIAIAFMPFLIIFVVGWLLGLILIPDYPEQVGAFRDNNPNITPEVAKKMMEEEIENKKTTVWQLNHTFGTRDFWFLSLPAGFLLMFSVGTMTQTNAILAQMGEGINQFGGFSGVMLMICIFGIIGSFVLGMLDQKLGTKKSMIIACCIMLVAGILGAVSSVERPGLLVAALICLALFMGASSNYTVSLAAQYWRREDFSTVFAAVNPIANIICALGPALIAILMIGFGYNTLFAVIGVVGVISILLCCLFSAKHVKAKDDKYRTAAGKPLDDALVGRK